LLSIAMLGVQIGWTRIFSFMIWYHFAFLVISTAMLGFTVGGLIFNLRPQLLERGRSSILFPSAFAFALGTALSLLAVCNLPFSGGVLDSLPNFGLFLLLVLLLAASFLSAGVFVAAVVVGRASGVSRLYAANMLGSGLGCALAGPLLDKLLPSSCVLVFSLIAAAGTVPLLRSVRAALLTAASALLIALGLWSSLDPLAEPFYMKSAKPFPALSKERIVARLSNSLSTIDLFVAENLTGLWGLSDQRYFEEHQGKPFPSRLGVCIDGWALTFMYKSDGEITREPVFDYLPATLAYDVASPKSALILGAGGGIDVISALRRGVQEITAVEINQATMDICRNMSSYNNGIFERPGVEPVVAEGRSFVTSSGERRWDLIQLSGVDTLAASQAGAFTLAESYLYTREAFESYLSHLAPGGVLTLTRWMSDPPRQTLRVISIADAALRGMGIENTRDHILLITDSRRAFSVFAISTTPFTSEQSERVLAVTRARGFVPLALPHLQVDRPVNVYEKMIGLQGEDKQSFIDAYPFDISVTTDDKPFFFEHTRWKNAWKYPDKIFDRFNGHVILLATTLLVALLGVVFILVPARFGLPKGAPASARVLGYFGCLGVSYVLVEMVLVQKLTLYLGNPAYALAVVLSALLMFSGLGSLLTGYAKVRVAAAAGSVALCLVLYRFGLDAVLHATLALDLGVRIALAIALLAVPALLMGMPFPLAIAQLSAAEPGLMIRGWVINGYCSVLGSCLAMILAISFGFGFVLLLGAAAYALAAWLWSHRS
jgi:hypothetical protein